MRSMLPAPEAREAVLSFYEKIGRPAMPDRLKQGRREV